MNATRSIKRAAQLVCIIFAVVVSAIVVVFSTLRQTPPALSIADSPKVVDATGELTITSIKMPAPRYIEGTGNFEKIYQSTLTVEVDNMSDEPKWLGLEYYVNAGENGVYSPGALGGTEIIQVPANWSSDVEFPVRHLRFIENGYISVVLAICSSEKSEALFLPGDAERLYKKKFNMVEKN